MVCDVVSFPFSFARRLALLLALVLLTAVPAFCQISYESAENHKQERKKFLKEAEKAEATYKDTHLNTGAYNFKKGEAGRRRLKAKDERGRYQFDENGEPVKKRKPFWKRKRKKVKKI